MDPTNHSEYCVLSFDGNLFHLNQDMISRDFSSTVYFDADEWLNLFDQHSNWGGGAVVSAKSFAADDIVVIEYAPRWRA